MATQTSSLVFLHYLTTVFDNLDEAIVLIGVEKDQHYRYLLANQSLASITGRLDNPVGKLVSDVVSPETYVALRKRYDHVVTTKQPASFTEQYQVPLGKETYELKLIPILNSVGEVVQIAAIARNVSKIKKLYEELRELRRQAKQKT